VATVTAVDTQPTPTARLMDMDGGIHTMVVGTTIGTMMVDGVMVVDGAMAADGVMRVTAAANTPSPIRDMVADTIAGDPTRHQIVR